MDRRTFLAATGALGAAAALPKAAHAADLQLLKYGSPLNLTGYRTVFEDQFDSFRPYHPTGNPRGVWATVGGKALDGSIRNTVLKRPMTVAEIDADPELRKAHRSPAYGGVYSMFTDRFLHKDLDPFTPLTGKLLMTAREVPKGLRTQTSGMRFMAPRIWLTNEGAPRCFTYGYFEARIELDVANAAHAAFWLLSKDGWLGEIDIMEYLGHWPKRGDQYHTSAHLDWGRLSFGEQLPGPMNNTPRRFGVMWTPYSLDFYLDRRLVRSLPNPGLHMPMYPIINLAVATPWSLMTTRGGSGMPLSTDFPMNMTLDHVLIAQKI